MVSKRLIAGLLVLLLPLGNLGAQAFGQFEGTVVAEWLKDGRRMRLVSHFAYVGPEGHRWEAPAGSIVDGASIPQFAWGLIGGPFEGQYRSASVLHDVACDEKTQPWELVHSMFYYAMRAGGVGYVKAATMYAAVYHYGPRWEIQLKFTEIDRGRAERLKNDKNERLAFFQSRLPEVDAGIWEADKRIKMEAKPSTRTNAQGIQDRPGNVDVTFTIEPGRGHLKKSDFEELRRLIEQRAATEEGEMSLEEIRGFRPGRQAQPR